MREIDAACLPIDMATKWQAVAADNAPHVHTARLIDLSLNGGVSGERKPVLRGWPQRGQPHGGIGRAVKLRCYIRIHARRRGRFRYRLRIPILRHLDSRSWVEGGT